MNRKLVGGLLALAVVVVGVWLLWTHPSGDARAVGTSEQRKTGKLATGSATGADDDQRSGEPTMRRYARWSLDVDPDGPLRLEGEVVGPDGKGLGGAEVWLDAQPERATVADDDGTFGFDKLVGHTYTITASSGNMIGATTYKLSSAGDPAIVRLSEGTSVRVSVVDDDKHAVADARVVVREARREAQTDAQGKATLQPLHPGWIVVEATAPGYAPARGFTTVGSSGASADVALVMRKGIAVSGRVVDDDGKPIPHAHVSAADDWAIGATDDVETDAAGKFAIPALAHGVHTLTAIDGKHAPATSPAFLVGVHAVDNVEIKMTMGASVAGVVVDKEGKPVAFATVRLAGDAAGRGRRWTEMSRATTTERDGTFRVGGLPRVKASARASTSDTASKVAAVDLEATLNVKDVKLVLDISGTIKGVVVDDTGKPVPEVSIHAIPDVFGGASTEELALAGMSSATSDGAGAFTISGLPDGSYRLWAARSANSSNWGQQGEAAKTGDTAARVVLPATGTLVAKLAIDGRTEPPKLASIIVGQQVPTPVAGGAVTVKDLAPGSYDVVFRGAEFAAFTRHDIEIKPGQTTDLGTVTLPRGRTVSGSVVDSAGTPVGGAKVKLGVMMFSAANDDGGDADNFDEMMGLRATVSDQDGSFTLVGVPVKSTNIVADHPDHGRSLGQPVAAGTDDLPPMTLTLRGYGSVIGKVTSKGLPVPDVQIAEASQGGGAQASFAKTSSDGSFVMSRVPEGHHVLTAMQPQLMSLKGTSIAIDVVVGQQAVANIDIPVGTISLQVALKPLPNAKVDAAQVFLFKGTVTFANGKVLLESFFQSGLEGMKFWLGGASAMPSYDELVAGDYSVCGIPVTGNLQDPKFEQRLQDDMENLKVYCKPVKLLAAPATQSAELDLPAMTPLPPPTN